jgi:hypothetical protein
MRRPFNPSLRKRQTRLLTGKKAAQRHQAWQARKGRPWAPWVRPLSIYTALNAADAADPDRASPPLPRGGRWS